MNLRICTMSKVGKKMSTSRDKVGESGDEVVNCAIKVNGMRVSRDTMDELSGVPLGSSGAFYNELGEPYQRMSFLLPDRELYVAGGLEHKRESGATVAELKLPRAIASSLRFNLYGPDDLGPTAILSFSLLWIAAGDEVDDVRNILTRQCLATFVFTEVDTQMRLFSDSKPSPVSEAAAGNRAKLDKTVARANALAAEGMAQEDRVPLDISIGASFEREAKEQAAKNPRREKPPVKR